MRNEYVKHIDMYLDILNAQSNSIVRQPNLCCKSVMYYEGIFKCKPMSDCSRINEILCFSTFFLKAIPAQLVGQQSVVLVV